MPHAAPHARIASTTSAHPTRSAWPPDPTHARYPHSGRCARYAYSPSAAMTDGRSSRGSWRERGERLSVAADQQRLDVVAVVRVERHIRATPVAAVRPRGIDEVEHDGGRDHDARERDGERPAGVGPGPPAHTGLDRPARLGA